MRLKACHIKICYQVNNSHCSSHESNMLELTAWPLYHLEETLHHPAGDEGLAPGLVASKVVEEGEESGGEGLREGCRGGSGGGEACNTVPHHDGQESMKVCGSGHINDGVEFRKTWVPVQVDYRGQRFQCRSLR